jgi:hypothetical protein
LLMRPPAKAEPSVQPWVRIRYSEPLPAAARARVSLRPTCRTRSSRAPRRARRAAPRIRSGVSASDGPPAEPPRVEPAPSSGSSALRASEAS